MPVNWDHWQRIMAELEAFQNGCTWHLTPQYALNFELYSSKYQFLYYKTTKQVLNFKIAIENYHSKNGHFP